MTWAWIGWLAVAVLVFAVLEWRALATGRLTLSMFTWQLSQKWPPLPFVLGLIGGGLAVHLWWHWCPPGSVSTG